MIIEEDKIGGTISIINNNIYPIYVGTDKDTLKETGMLLQVGMTLVFNALEVKLEDIFVVQA